MYDSICSTNPFGSHRVTYKTSESFRFFYKSKGLFTPPLGNTEADIKNNTVENQLNFVLPTNIWIISFYDFENDANINIDTKFKQLFKMMQTQFNGSVDQNDGISLLKIQFHIHEANDKFAKTIEFLSQEQSEKVPKAKATVSKSSSTNGTF